ncbi:MAG: DNA polymerase [Syntrophorhabdales bacterium]
MNELDALPFSEIWVVDSEFEAPPGENPAPVCLVAWELRTGRKVRVWRDELRTMRRPPYDIGKGALFVSYYSSAELGCHLSLGWALPHNNLDLYVEFRNRTNGLTTPSGNSLLGALVAFGLDSITTTEKDSMRNLVIRGGPWSVWEQKSILDYCESDVEATSRLLSKMTPGIDVDRALLRGRYMKAVASIERNGVPIDTDTLRRLNFHWEDIQSRLVETLNNRYGVYEGLTFKLDRFTQYLASNDIPWPRLESGALDLSDEVFKEMGRTYPQVEPLRELRVTLAQMRLNALQIGRDSRNRCLLSPFSSRSGRNQPSNTRFIFGPAVWLRGLIKPEPGWGLVYVDWEQQEFGIAAALSGDERMAEAYNSGDPYLTFAKQAGAVPKDATKESHPKERELFKLCALGTQYGMGSRSFSQRIRQPHIVGQELLRLHRETYRTFWRWSDSAQDAAMLGGKLWTVFGWTIHLSGNINPRPLRNFPMQANGAEVLRLACCFATEEGIRVCAPVHDALLIEAPLGELDETIAATQEAMARASALVLGGFRLRSEAKVVRYPDRYEDERGRVMWDTITGIISDLEKDVEAMSVSAYRRSQEQKFSLKKKEPERFIKSRTEFTKERYPHYHFFTQDPAFKSLLPALLQGEDVGAGYNTSFNRFVERFNEAMAIGDIPVAQPPADYASGVKMEKGEVQWGIDAVAGLIRQEMRSYRDKGLISNPKHEEWLMEREVYVRTGLSFFGLVEDQDEEASEDLIEEGFVSEEGLY